MLDGCKLDRCRRLMNWDKKEFFTYLLRFIGIRQLNNQHQIWLKQTRYCQWWISQVVIKTDRSDKTEIKKFFLKISGPQQGWPRPLPGAILIPPALLVVADWAVPGSRFKGYNRRPLLTITTYPSKPLNAEFSFPISTSDFKIYPSYPIELNGFITR